jgi:hypothetical protein
MVLFVAPDRFADEVRRHCPRPLAYVWWSSGFSRATAAEPTTGTIVQTEAPGDLDTFVARLKADGLEVAHGQWLTEVEAAEHDRLRPVWIAAVSYRSGDERPGLWVDTSHSAISVTDALMRMYEEFEREGHVHDLVFEEFVRLIDANVVVMSPEQAQAFAIVQGPANPLDQD